MTRRLIKQDHFKNLIKFCQISESRGDDDLLEYFQSLSNNYSEILEKDFFNKTATKKFTPTKENELTAIELQKQKQNAFISKNISHCEYCKVNYFNSKHLNNNNIRPEIRPKCRLTNRNAKLLTRFKLLNKKFKYNSYKQRLVKKLIKTSIRIVYKCKRCKSNNLIFKEAQRSNLDKLKLIGVRSTKTSYDLLITKSKSLQQQSSLTTTTTTTTAASSASKQKNFYRNKKFQSLKLALESDKKEKSQKAESTVGASLTDFLEKLKK